MSCGTLVGSEYDYRPENCILRMSGQPMVGMSFSMTELCSSSTSCLLEKGLDVCQSIDGIMGGCSLLQFMLQGSIVWFVVNSFHLRIKEYLRLNYFFGMVA